MGSEPLLPFQKAIYDRLNGHSNLSGKVFDSVPEDTSYPYVVIGDDTSEEWDTKTKKGAEITATIHVWSQARGRMECKQYMGYVNDQLDNYDLEVTGHHVVLLYQEFSNVELDPDGETHHGVMRFRALTQED